MCEMRFSIPVEICSYVLSNHLVNPFRSFLLLKDASSGKQPYIKNELIKIIGVSDKTFERHLLELRKLNWIGINPKSGILFIRSFDKIREMHGYDSRKAVIFKSEDLINLRAFLFGAVISDIVRNKRRRFGWCIAAKEGYARHMHHLPFFHPIANSYMTRILRCSITTAVKHKKYAEKCGYISTKSNIIATQVSIDKYSVFKNKTNQESYLLRRYGDVIGIQQPDLISSNMRFTRRRKV